MALFGFSPKLQCKIEAVRPHGAVKFCRMLLTFLEIGTVGFGGGMAIVALMEKAFVRKHRVLSSEEFIHGVGLGQILGPFAVNTALFTGYRLFGPAGALLSGFFFMAPSIVMVLALSWLYFTYHTIPTLQTAMAGLAPVVIALIFSAAWSMGEKVVRKLPAALVTMAAIVAGITRINSVYILVAGGVCGLLIGKRYLAPSGQFAEVPEAARKSETTATGHAPALLLAAPASSAAVSFGTLCLTFLKVGFVFFGGGFVLIPVLYNHLVTNLHWLTSQQFVDGLAISNLTPGPVSVLATFAGYRMMGVMGGIAATCALYAPSVALMLILSHGYERFHAASRTQDFLAGISAATVGLVLSAGVVLGGTTLASWRAYACAAISLFLLGCLKWPPLVVLAGGVVLGLTSVVP